MSMLVFWWTCRCIPTFRSNILPPSSGLTTQKTNIDNLENVCTLYNHGVFARSLHLRMAPMTSVFWGYWPVCGQFVWLLFSWVMTSWRRIPILLVGNFLHGNSPAGGSRRGNLPLSHIFIWTARYCSPISTKIWMQWQSLVRLSNIKCNKNPFCDSRIGKSDRQIWWS